MCFSSGIIKSTKILQKKGYFSKNADTFVKFLKGFQGAEDEATDGFSKQTIFLLVPIL
jgi:hypothetical protein